MIKRIFGLLFSGLVQETARIRADRHKKSKGERCMAEGLHG